MIFYMQYHFVYDKAKLFYTQKFNAWEHASTSEMSLQYDVMDTF